MSNRSYLLSGGDDMYLWKVNYDTDPDHLGDGFVYLDRYFKYKRKAMEFAKRNVSMNPARVWIKDTDLKRYSVDYSR